MGARTKIAIIGGDGIGPSVTTEAKLLLELYRDKVGLPIAKQLKDSTGFVFGDMTLWIDRVERQSQVDVWLELFTDDPDAAITHLGSPLRDELEPLDGVTGHWTSDPAGVVLLVRRE